MSARLAALLCLAVYLANGPSAAMDVDVRRLLVSPTQLTGNGEAKESAAPGTEHGPLNNGRVLKRHLEKLPDGTSANWQSPDGRARYRLQVHDSFQVPVGERCRAFTLSAWEADRFSQAFRTACRNQAGRWSLIFGD